LDDKQAGTLANLWEWLNEIEPSWNLEEEEPKKSESHYKYNFEYDYLTLEKDPKTAAVKLYKASDKKVHPDERNHTLLHQYFCRKPYCKYHMDY